MFDLHQGSILLSYYIVLLLSYSQAFSIDVIAMTAFGLKLDTQEDPNDPFVEMGKRFFDMTVQKMQFFLMCRYHSVI